MAAALHVLYVAIDEARPALPDPREQRACTLRKRPEQDARNLEVLAASAFAGELGSEAKELAQYFLVDEAGRERRDAVHLRRFALALKALRASQPLHAR